MVRNIIVSNIERIPVGCESVFPAGLKQTEFSLSTDFFKLNPRLREFDIELNVTRCMTTPKGKVLCASGLTALRWCCKWKFSVWKSLPGLKSTILPSKAVAGKIQEEVLGPIIVGILLQNFQPRSDRRVWPSQSWLQHSPTRYLPHTLSSMARPQSACHHQVHF